MNMVVEVRTCVGVNRWFPPRGFLYVRFFFILSLLFSYDTHKMECILALYTTPPPLFIIYKKLYHLQGILIAGLSLSTCSPLMLVLTQLMPSMSPWWYYGFHASTGIINWMAVALSALADVLPQKFRAPGVGLLLAGFMVGFSLSPVFAFFFNRLELSFISFSMVLAGLLATYFILPETLSSEAAEAAKKRNRRPNNASSSDTDGTTSPNGQIRYWLRRILRFISRPAREMSILNRSTFFRLISTLAFFSGMVASGDQLLLVYYVEERLGFDEKDVSYMFMIIGIFGLLAQGIVLKPLNDCIGEKYVVALCFTIGAIDNTMYGLARNKATIYIAAGCAAFTSMAFPTISAMKANNVVSKNCTRKKKATHRVIRQQKKEREKSTTIVLYIHPAK